MELPHIPQEVVDFAMPFIEFGVFVWAAYMAFMLLTIAASIFRR